MSRRAELQEQIAKLRARFAATRDPHERARLARILREVEREMHNLPLPAGPIR